MDPTPQAPDPPARANGAGGRVLALTTIVLLSAFTASFAAGTAFGVTDEAALQAWLLHDERGRAALCALLLVLLVGDLILPVPSSVVMSVSGMAFGVVGGTILNGVGSVCGALLGYSLCRRFGAKAFARLVGSQDLPHLRAQFETRGSWVVLASRAVPMVTETVSCLAGLLRMPAPQFLGLTVAGSVPLGAVYAWAGAELGARAGVGGPVVVALVLPLLGYAGWRRSPHARGGSDPAGQG